MTSEFDWSGFAAQLTEHVRARPAVIGITGSVAVGKSTFCQSLMAAMAPHGPVTSVATDGFLKPNRLLEAEGLTLKKGFPASYDQTRMHEAIGDLRRGVARVPVYSHVTYDVDDSAPIEVRAEGLVLLEGLGFTPVAGAPDVIGALDLMIYLDADEADLEHWFSERFMRLWHAAEQDETSFYRNFRHMSVPEAEAFARTVWTGINLPNLREHILDLRPVADIVFHKQRDHSLRIVRWTDPAL